MKTRLCCAVDSHKLGEHEWNRLKHPANIDHTVVCVCVLVCVLHIESTTICISHHFQVCLFFLFPSLVRAAEQNRGWVFPLLPGYRELLSVQTMLTTGTLTAVCVLEKE